jgi:hypothetical protein
MDEATEIQIMRLEKRIEILEQQVQVLINNAPSQKHGGHHVH